MVSRFDLRVNGICIDGPCHLNTTPLFEHENVVRTRSRRRDTYANKQDRLNIHEGAGAPATCFCVDGFVLALYTFY